MQILIIFICLFSSIVAYKLNKNIYNPTTIFGFIWFIIIFLSNLRLFGMNQGSEKTYFIIFIGIISFLFGSSILGIFQIRFDKENINKKICLKGNYRFILNKKVIHMLIILAMSILIITAIRSINLILSGHDLAYVRYVANNEITNGNKGFLSIAFDYLAQPICQLMIPVFILNMFSKNKDNKLIIESIILIILLVISNGGRFILLYCVIHFLFIGSFIGKKFNFNKINKKKIIIFIILLVSIMTYITVARGSSIGKTLYTYTSGCVPHMSLRIKNFDMYGEYTYGFSSFQGFIRPIFTFLRKLGLITNLPDLLQIAEKLSLQVENPIIIGGNIIYNAFVSWFYYFYIDFNIFGVVFISCIYGYLCKAAYYRLQRTGSNISIIIYSLILQTIITSMFRFQYSTFIFALTFIYLILIKPKKR